MRLLAHALRMNYAWGLEFVELTRGTREEQNATAGRDNAIGLHGNAILSKCALSEAEVLRGPFDERYFSRDATPTNAHGYERRLGGRMALLARLQVGSIARITVGAMHKFIASGGVGNRLWARLNASAGTVLAGDQNGQLCQSFGLADLWAAGAASAAKTTPFLPRATRMAASAVISSAATCQVCTSYRRHSDRASRGLARRLHCPTMRSP